MKHFWEFGGISKDKNVFVSIKLENGHICDRREKLKFEISRSKFFFLRKIQQVANNFDKVFFVLCRFNLSKTSMPEMCSRFSTWLSKALAQIDINTSTTEISFNGRGIEKQLGSRVSTTKQLSKKDTAHHCPIEGQESNTHSDSTGVLPRLNRQKGRKDNSKVILISSFK